MFSVDQAPFKEEAGFLGRLLPTDAPLDGFAGPLVEQQVEVKILPFLERQQVADVPAPPLVGPGQRFANRSFGVAVVGSARTAGGHQVLLLEDAVNRGERGLEEALIPSRDRQDAMRQIDVLLTLGHRHNLLDLLGQHPMQGLFGTRRQVGQALPLARLLLPADDAPVGDHQDRTTAAHRNTLLLGGLNHREDFQFGLRINPLPGYRTHEPPVVFFRRIASSTDRSARARSFSWSSCLRAS